jgi:hypothetical protein
MKRAVIFSHPRQDSFTASVAAAHAQSAEGLGYGVIRHDLHGMQEVSGSIPPGSAIFVFTESSI